MGATVVEGGVIFRTWAPSARAVYVVTNEAETNGWKEWTPRETQRLQDLGDGTFGLGVAGLTEGSRYLFWVVGPEGGSEGFKRDPYAREIAMKPDFPNGPCVVQSDAGYAWRCVNWRPRPYHELVIYQLHVGAFWAVDEQGRDARGRYGRFLDVIERLPYLRALGVTAVQLLPVQEFDSHYGLGYAGGLFLAGDGVPD